jgi:predicted TIM-barrel fold metal-dependent hydrolase
MLTCPHAIIDHVDRIAERHPGLRLTMDHLGLLPGTKDEEAFREFDKLLALARRPNVAVKASALPCYTSDVYPYRRLYPYVRKAIDAFGPQRVFWGTDLSRLPCRYREAVTMFTEEMPLTASEKESVMGRALCRWLGWALD